MPLACGKNRTGKTNSAHFMNLVFHSRTQDQNVGSGVRPTWVRLSAICSLACALGKVTQSVHK